jgi:hypothetical protein
MGVSGRGRALALSTAQSDSLEIVANNWPNIVLWLHQPLTLEAGQQRLDFRLDPKLLETPQALGAPAQLVFGGLAAMAPSLTEAPV